MKTILVLVFVLISIESKSQIISIECYYQNSRVLNYSNNLILNGGFENNTCFPDSTYNHSFCPNSLYYDCDIANWVCTGGGLGTYSNIIDSAISFNNNYSIIIEGNYAAYFGNYICASCTDTSDTSCIANLNCEVTGIPSGYPINDLSFGGNTGVSLSQTLSGLTIGNNYALEFWTGGEYMFLFSRSGLFAVDVGFGNIFLRDPPTPPITGIGKRYVITFKAIADSQSIKFTNWGHASSACTELILDDVQLFHLHNEIVNEYSENSDIKIYPNPVLNNLNINLNNNDPSTIILYDILSRNLLHQTFIRSTTLNMEQLTNGIYIYKVLNKNGTIELGKVIKQ